MKRLIILVQTMFMFFAYSAAQERINIKGMVVENGIRHEGQQWGADHGLEIDQYAVERIEVVKGPASVMFGSGAIGGLLRVYQDPVPASNTLTGNMELTGRSNNNIAGGSFSLAGRCP